jgi:formamidopyrimidine-DNA glycosylase
LKKEIEKKPTRDPFNKFIHFVLKFENGKFLIMSDLRKFGTIKILDEEEYQKVKNAFGPEPFDLSPKQFIELVRKKGKGRAKNVLMKPEFIAGIGNIYSDEIL